MNRTLKYTHSDHNSRYEQHASYLSSGGYGMNQSHHHPVEEDVEVEEDELMSDDCEEEDGGGTGEQQRGGVGGDEGDDDDDDDDDEEEEESDEEYQEYQKFISTIFQDELSDMSGTDADEDEDYTPDEVGGGQYHGRGQGRRGLLLEEDDDEETDDEYFNVTRKEVHDLVDASLQVLAKTTPVHPLHLQPDSYPHAGHNSASTSTSSSGGHSHGNQRPSPNTFTNPSNQNQSSGTQPVAQSDSNSNPPPSVSTSSSSPAEHFEHFEQLEQMQKRNRLISAVVSKMFAGENEDSLVVDDMPIHNIRKLVARQMSMSLQLMIQMLLLSDNMSESDRQCSSHLMELSNLRSSALTKTYLITEQIETLKAYQSFANQNQLHAGNNTTTAEVGGATPNGAKKQSSAHKKKGNVGQNSRFLFDVDDDDDDEDEDYVDDGDSDGDDGVYSQNMMYPYGGQGGIGSGESGQKRARRQQQARTNQHMTRTRAANDPSLTRTSSSIFNIPTLSRVHVLLQAIDSARKERDRVFREYVAARQLQLQQQKGGGGAVAVQQLQPHTQLQSLNPVIAGSNGNNGSRGYLTSITAEERTAMFHITAKRLEQQIAPYFCVRLWKCLLPSRDYPLSPEFVSAVNPASLYGSTIFTPAEDDLLLRGIISVANAEGGGGGGDKCSPPLPSWEQRVKEKYLPSKEQQLLQYRQIQLESGPEDSKFKRYREFEQEKQRHQKWTSDQDKELLRGFQVFGSKWFMIKLYFLPNKSRHEIKLRWNSLLKDWEKNFQKNSLKSIVKSDGKLVKSIKHFLKTVATGAGAQKKKTPTPPAKNNSDIKKEPASSSTASSKNKSTSKKRGSTSPLAPTISRTTDGASVTRTGAETGTGIGMVPATSSSATYLSDSLLLQHPLHHLNFPPPPTHAPHSQNHYYQEQLHQHLPSRPGQVSNGDIVRVTDGDREVVTDMPAPQKPQLLLQHGGIPPQQARNVSGGGDDDKLVDAEVMSDSDSDGGGSKAATTANTDKAPISTGNHQLKQVLQLPQHHHQQLRQQQPPLLYTYQPPPPHAVTPNGRILYPRGLTLPDRLHMNNHSAIPVSMHMLPPSYMSTAPPLTLAHSSQLQNILSTNPPHKQEVVPSPFQGGEMCLGDNPAPLEMLLAEKSIPSLLGKKRKKDKEERPKTTKKPTAAVVTSVAVKNTPAVSAHVTGPKAVMTSLQTAATAGSCASEDMSMQDHFDSKKPRSVHFAQIAATAPEDSRHKMGKEGSGGGSFRLFDSVMSAANKQ